MALTKVMRYFTSYLKKYIYILLRNSDCVPPALPVIFLEKKVQIYSGKNIRQLNLNQMLSGPNIPQQVS